MKPDPHDAVFAAIMAATGKRRPAQPTSKPTKPGTLSPKQIIAALAGAGLSQSEAARRMHISDRTMRRYIAGYPMRPAKAKKFLAMCAKART